MPFPYNPYFQKAREMCNYDFAEDLRAAMAAPHLHLFFQPRVCLQTCRAAGAEVFLGWDHPVVGLVPVSQWGGLTESHNLMHCLTLWLIDKVIEKIKAAGRLGVPMAINISPHILNGALALYIMRNLKTAHLPFHLLEIEVSEAIPVTDTAILANAIGILKDKGIKVYLSNVGKGYSTMKYFVELPIYGIKIDKSFVQGAPANKSARLILKTIIDLAAHAGLKVICEGVKTRAQLKLAGKLGAQFFQGPLAGQLMSFEAFTRYIPIRNHETGC